MSAGRRLTVLGSRVLGVAGAVVGLALTTMTGAASAAAPNTWTSVAPLATPRFYHVAAVLTNGDVLVAGGADGSTVMKSAAVYDPAANAWTPVGDMGAARYRATAVTLPNGKVLVVGGGTSSTADASALATGELYDPAAKSWTPVPGSMSSARGKSPMAVLLQSGKVLIAGGTDTSGIPVATADLYDPSTNSFSPTGSMDAPRAEAAVARLSNGKVLVAGGHTTKAAESGSAGGDVYDPVSGTWTPVSNQMVTAKVLASAAALPNGKALIAGGQSVFGSVTTVSTDLYDPATNAFTAGPSMNAARAAFASSTLPGGRVLAAGGVVQDATTTNTVVRTQVYDPAANAWLPVAALPLARAAATATALPSGAVLVTGGTNDVVSGVSDVELFTPPGTPSAPGAVSAAASNSSATVTFAPPASDGGFPVLHYTVTASTGQTVHTPDARTVATIPGLANGRRVTFTVTATNVLGTGPNSAASNGVTPAGPPVAVPAPKLALRGLSTSLRVKSFLNGVRFTVTPDRAAALHVTLLGSVGRATIARAYQLVLAARTFTSSSSRRTITLVPAKKLVGNPKRATVELVIVAIGSNGSRSTTMRQIRIRR